MVVVPSTACLGIGSGKSDWGAIFHVSVAQGKLERTVVGNSRIRAPFFVTWREQGGQIVENR